MKSVSVTHSHSLDLFGNGGCSLVTQVCSMKVYIYAAGRRLWVSYKGGKVENMSASEPPQL